jgi:hypothetical protein
VSVDGEPVGTTPLAELAVTIGTRQVVVRHPEHGEGRYTVDVRAGRVTPVSARISSTPAPEGVAAMPSMNAPLRVVR